MHRGGGEEEREVSNNKTSYRPVNINVSIQFYTGLSEYLISTLKQNIWDNNHKQNWKICRFISTAMAIRGYS